MKLCKPAYLEQALLLSEEDRVRVLSRMNGKMAERLRKKKLSVHEALALQLEKEEKNLLKWRRKMGGLGKRLDVAGTQATETKAVQKASPNKEKSKTDQAIRSRVSLDDIAPVGWPQVPAPLL